MNDNQYRVISEIVGEVVENGEFKCERSRTRLIEVLDLVTLALTGRIGHFELDNAVQCLCSAQKSGVLRPDAVDFAITAYVIPARDIVSDRNRTE